MFLKFTASARLVVYVLAGNRTQAVQSFNGGMPRLNNRFEVRAHCEIVKSRREVKSSHNGLARPF